MSNDDYGILKSYGIRLTAMGLFLGIICHVTGVESTTASIMTGGVLFGAGLLLLFAKRMVYSMRWIEGLLEQIVEWSKKLNA
ncbi:hypothetical protein MYX07_05880 [Patescibacteria group bacterium AH-259-L07]|nr:hypothetical protein [Patescibacteria group bacterium AH-259-L07]